DDLVAQLQRVYGSGLVAVVLFGSAAAGEHIAGRSDYNVLVLVDAVNVERLRAMAAALIGWRKAGHAAPQLMTVAEWRSAADAFPMEYADIIERHRVLFGTAPFEGIRVAPRDLRVQVEHQARGKLLQLRQRVLGTGTSPDPEIIELLAGASSTIMIVFRGLERLHGAVPDADNEALARGVASRVGFDPDPFVRVIRHVRGTERIVVNQAVPVLDGYLTGLERVVGHVDGLVV
ncbi:MAG TPA: hypothetical protein VNW46_18305, partial [Gemmatimonadaceae bacterium]|nr:hypothetical protein [Gemmatimonadaceae bacterium]